MRRRGSLAILFCALIFAASAATEGVCQEARVEHFAPGDSISLKVFGEPDMDGTLHIGADGTVNIPLVGPVAVAGMTHVDASAKVEESLRANGILLNPHVTLTLVQANLQRVSVLGEVRNPGRYSLEPGATIFDVLALAGGVTELAGDDVRITRQDQSGGIAEHAISLRDRGSNASAANSAAWTLRHSDRIYVPRASRFYIQGEVRNPNSYRIERGLTFLQAISLAGGLTDVGSARRLEVTRVRPDGKTERVRVKPDDLVQPDDVIVVKESIF